MDFTWRAILLASLVLVFSKVAKNVQLQVVVPAKEAFL
jgi:hypothetical protein